ncbi:MAG: hypothetical protein ABJD07_03665 [Gemmatimonadaceae bacterium]
MQSVRVTSAALVAAAFLSHCLVKSTAAQGAVAPPTGRRCARLAEPEPLPRLSFVIDVDGLRKSLGPVGDGVAFFSVAFEPSGYPKPPVLAQSTFSDTLDNPLTLAVASALRDQPNGKPWSALLRLTGGNPLRIELQRSLECHAEQSGSLGAFDAWLNERVVGGRRLTEWMLFAEVRVDTLGAPMEAKVLGPAPYPDMTGIHAALARLVTFSPPTFDGRPVVRTDTVAFGIQRGKP